MSELSKADVEPTNVADGWPAEAPSPEAAPRDASGVYGQERTRIGAPAYRPEKRQEKRPVVVRSSQAVHVVVWRDPDGSLRIAPRGTVVSAVTIDALLVAPGPDVDLIAWLSS